MGELYRLQQRHAQISQQLKSTTGPGEQFRLQAELQTVENTIRRLGGLVPGATEGSVREYLNHQRRFSG